MALLVSESRAPLCFYVAVNENDDGRHDNDNDTLVWGCSYYPSINIINSIINAVASPITFITVPLLPHAIQNFLK